MEILGPYNLGWEAGEDKLLIISVGTGTSPDANADLIPNQMNLLYNASCPWRIGTQAAIGS